MSDRPEPPATGDESTLLGGFLDFLRATMLERLSGLDHEAANRAACPPSTLSIAALVKHLALVEDYWFHHIFAGGEPGEPWASAPFDDDPDWDFHSAAHDEPSSIAALYVESCDRSRAHAQQAPNLETLAVRTRPSGEQVSLRWILIHMIEETARHAGHADLVREAIDGVTGE